MAEHAAKYSLKTEKALKSGWFEPTTTFLLTIKNYIFCAPINAEKFEVFRENLFGVRTQMVHFSSGFGSKISFKIKKEVIMYLQLEFIENFF